MKVSEKVIHNTLFSSIGYVWWVLVSLFLTPYIIAKVGIQGYGVFVVIEAALGYVTALDITGLNISLAKFVSEHNANKDFGKLHSLVRMGLVYYLFFYGAVGAVVWVLRGPFLRLFRIEPVFVPTAMAVLAGLLGIMVFKGVFSIYKAVLLGLQRMDVENVILVVAVTLNIGFTVFLLERGMGIKGLVLAGLLMICFSAGLRAWWVNRLLPKARAGSRIFDKDLFKSAFFYGIQMQMIAFSELINKGVDKVLLGALAGVSLSALYEIGAKVANITNLFPALFLPSVLPAASELQVLRDERRLQDLYVRGTKYLVVFLAPVCFFAVSHASLIILAWMGFMARQESVLAVQFLTVAYGAYLLTSVGRYIARGIGVLRFELAGSVFLTVSNIVLSVILILRYGYVGALWGTAISAFCGSGWFLVAFHRYLKFSIGLFMRKSVFWPVAISLLASLIMEFFPASWSADGSRLILLAKLFGHLVLFGCLYLIIIWLCGFVDAYEREVFTNAFKSLFKRRVSSV